MTLAEAGYYGLTGNLLSFLQLLLSNSSFHFLIPRPPNLKPASLLVRAYFSEEPAWVWKTLEGLCPVSLQAVWAAAGSSPWAIWLAKNTKGFCLILLETCVCISLQVVRLGNVEVVDDMWWTATPTGCWRADVRASAELSADLERAVIILGAPPFWWDWSDHDSTSVFLTWEPEVVPYTYRSRLPVQAVLPSRFRSRFLLRGFRCFILKVTLCLQFGGNNSSINIFLLLRCRGDKQGEVTLAYRLVCAEFRRSSKLWDPTISVKSENQLPCKHDQFDLKQMSLSTRQKHANKQIVVSMGWGLPAFRGNCFISVHAASLICKYFQ